MDRHFGAQPPPCLLVLGMEAEQARDALSDLFPTIEAALHPSHVDQTAFDAVLAVGVGDDLEANLRPHLQVVAIGCLDAGRISDNAEINMRGAAVIGGFRRPGDLADDVARAVDTDLGPKAEQLRGGTHRYIRAVSTGNLAFEKAMPAQCKIVFEGAGKALALHTPRRDPRATIWILPEYADPHVWLEVALARWRRDNPTRFPFEVDWTQQVQWRTPAEVAALDDLEALATKRESLLAEIARREEQIQATLDDATAAADAAERRLLTTKSSELVEAVADALRSLRFDVHDMDDVHPESQKLEDLRITHPEYPGWEAVVEIKGYGGGAQMNDILKIMRFAQAYEREKDNPPSACWYVVNQLMGRDPTTRPKVLTSNDTEVATFVNEWNAALIDTSHLFQLVTQAQTEVERAGAAKLLVELRGRLSDQQQLEEQNDQ